MVVLKASSRDQTLKQSNNLEHEDVIYLKIKMELSTGVFEARHADNTEVLLALLTQNKELEGNKSHYKPRL